PLADGPTIQRTTQTALEQGMTVPRVLELIRDAALAVPVIIMTYLNPVLAYGVERFAKAAHDAGAAGVLLTDLPVGADPAIEAAVTNSALSLIRLVAPTTDDRRLTTALQGATGFVYLISRLGVTGARADVPPDLDAQVRRVRAASSARLPVAVRGLAVPLSKYSYLTQTALVGLTGSLLVGVPATALAIAGATTITDWIWQRKPLRVAWINLGREVITLVAAYGVYAAALHW